jgi:aminodeoxyfutalosine deaminase
MSSLPSNPSPSPNLALPSDFDILPKAELHLHLEGSIAPATVVELAARYRDVVDEATVAARYATPDFSAFIEAYIWVTSYLRAPEDYALITRRLAEHLLTQNVVYTEVTLSVGVMLLRGQDVEANFHAIREAAAPFEPKGLRMQWIFDAVRQFGADKAMEVAQHAVDSRNVGVVAYGLGGDELAIPTADFRPVYEFIASHGLRRLAHAGEIGGPESVREAIDLLGAERIGHGIATFRDPQLMALLSERSIPLEVCPTSNLCTGALARQRALPHVSVLDHPLPQLLRAGVPLSLSTDDPAMFGTHLNREYALLPQMGLRTEEIVRVAAAGFEGAFLPPADKSAYLAAFRAQAAALGLL